MKKHNAETVDRERELLDREWPARSPMQRVHRVALIELVDPDEWLELGSIFDKRGQMLLAAEDG